MNERNIKLVIEYDGTRYEGWQTQNPPKGSGRRRDVKTVQAEVIRALRRVLQQKKVVLNGSGRTDSGVHARGQVANFRTSSTILPGKLRQALNSLLPPDIVVTGVEEVEGSFHSRYSAKWKTYRYTILNREYRGALNRDFSLFCSYPLDVPVMAREAAEIKGTHDFTSFHAAGASPGSSIRTIRSIKVSRAKDVVSIEVEANGFLKNMVRTIAGTLIELGRGKLPPGSMRRILAARDRKSAGPTAPPQGLCLIRVKY